MVRAFHFAAACYLVFSAPFCVSGTVITPGAGAVAAGCLGARLSSTIGDCSLGGATAATSGGPVTLIQTFSGNSDTVSVSALGAASFGVLRSSASATYSIAGSPTNAFAFADAFFNDVITISYDPWNGTTGLLYINYDLDGTISSSGSAKALVGIQILAGPDSNLQTRVQSYTNSLSGTFSAGLPIEFVYGQPFNFSFLMSTCAGGGDLCGRSPVSQTGAGTADFSNTLVLSSLVPFDQNGSLAEGAVFSSGSGTRYAASGVSAVPEPSYSHLAAIATLAIVIKAREKLR